MRAVGFARRHWKASLGLVVALIAGLALGAGTVEPETLTVSITETETRTTTRVRTRTIKPRPAVVTRRETVVRHQTVTEPPSAGGVFVDYGEFEGGVLIHGVQWYDEEYGGTSVIGQAELIGPGGCNALTYLQIDATLFDSSGTIRETGFANLTSVPRGSRVPFKLTLDADITQGRVELIVTQAQC